MLYSLAITYEPLVGVNIMSTAGNSNLLWNITYSSPVGGVKPCRNDSSWKSHFAFTKILPPPASCLVHLIQKLIPSFKRQISTSFIFYLFKCLLLVLILSGFKFKICMLTAPQMNKSHWLRKYKKVFRLKYCCHFLAENSNLGHFVFLNSSFPRLFYFHFPLLNQHCSLTMSF